MLDFVEDVVVDEEALATWYGENEDRFEEPEKVVVAMLVYRGGDFEEGIVLEEDDIVAEYEAGRETTFQQENEISGYVGSVMQSATSNSASFINDPRSLQLHSVTDSGSRFLCFLSSTSAE